MEIIPTVVPKRFEDIEALAARFNGIAKTLHIDVTDGSFTEDETWLPPQEGELPQLQEISYEAHLMMRDPRAWGERFIRMGAWRIIGHLEALGEEQEARNTLQAWRAFGAHEVGIAVMINTPIDRLAPLADYCDSCTVMTIGTIGSQGAAFDRRGVERVRRIHERFPNLVIAADGGVSDETIQDLVAAGATRFAVGSFLSRAKDPVEAYQALKEVAEA